MPAIVGPEVRNKGVTCVRLGELFMTQDDNT